MTSLTRTNSTVDYNPRGWAGLPSNLVGSISEYLGAGDTLSLRHTCKILCTPVKEEGWGSAKAERAWEIVFGDATRLGHPQIAKLVYEYSPLDGPDLYSLYRRAYNLVRESFSPSHFRQIFDKDSVHGIHGIQGIHDFMCLPTLDPMVKRLSARAGDYFDSRELLDVQGARHPVMKFCHAKGWSLVINVYMRRTAQRELRTYQLFSTGGTVWDVWDDCQYTLLTEQRIISSNGQVSASQKGASGVAFGGLDSIFGFSGPFGGSNGPWKCYFKPVLNFEDSQNPWLLLFEDVED